MRTYSDLVDVHAAIPTRFTVVYAVVACEIDLIPPTFLKVSTVTLARLFSRERPS